MELTTGRSFLEQSYKMGLKRGILLFVAAAFVLQGAANDTRKTCPMVDAMANFNAAEFTGRWFEIKRTKTLVDALRGICSSVNFTVNSKQNITVSLSTKVGGRIVNTQNYALMSSSGVLDWTFNIGNCGQNISLTFEIVLFHFFNYSEV